MIGRERAFEILEQVMDRSPGDQTEAVLWGTHSHLTRFCDNHIHQNTSESNLVLSVRVVVGKRIGCASTNTISDEGLREVVERASRIARLQKDDPDFVSLPLPRDDQAADVRTFFEATAGYTPEDRALAARCIIECARTHSLAAAGAFSTGTEELAVANSLGIRAYNLSTSASLNTVVMSGTGSGYASAVSRDVRDIHPEELGDRAVQKCLASMNPVAVEPGEYTVILEEPAVATLLEFLGYLGFGALAVQEERSFMCGRFGERIMGENISIWDDGLDPEGLAMPFDYEGVPKQKVVLVEKGVARSVVYDSYTAGREGKRSTGHALQAPNTLGPMPLNMFLDTGDATLEEMIRSTERGLLITRFHYTNPVHPMKAIITGMTRDGTFLVEGGEVSRAVKNLRFTESILTAMSNVEMIGKQRRLHGDEFFSIAVPPLKISSFSFTGATDNSF